MYHVITQTLRAKELTEAHVGAKHEFVNIRGGEGLLGPPRVSELIGINKRSSHCSVFTRLRLVHINQSDGGEQG